LIDGHRMAPNPLSDDGQRSFVDISNLPFDAIERIEVLKDGASAVYGSDAMAGVVNIILKKNFIGTKVNAEGAGTTEGGGATVHASVIHGMGDLDADGYNAYVSLEYRHQDPITYDQRAGDGLWANQNLSSIGGVNRQPGVITSQNGLPSTLTPYLINPALPSNVNPLTSAIFNPAGACGSLSQLTAGGCAYTNPKSDVEPQTQNVNLLASFTKKLSDGWKLDVKASVFDSQADVYAFNSESMTTFPQSYSQGSGQGGLSVAAGVAPHLVGPGSISSITVPAGYMGIVPASWTSGALVNGVISGAPAVHENVENKAMRLVADLTGTIGEWDVDTSLGYTKVGTNQDIIGSMNIPALNAALNRSVNPFNIYGGNSAADMAAIFPETSAYDTSLLEFAEFHASRSLMQLPGGDLGFSSGASFIHRDMESPAPLLVSEGVVGGNNAYVSGAQNDAAVYMELAAPVLKTLEIDGAVRFDHFDNAGNSTTPKLSFKWTPSNEIALRGSLSTGFRAPNPAENGNSGQSYLAQTTYDPVLCPGGFQANGNPPKGAVVNLNGQNLCNYEPTALNSATPNLSPEKSLSQTLGVILEPIKGWSTTVDVYQIKINDQIIAPALDLQTAVPVRGSPVQALCSDGTATGTYSCTTSVGPALYYPAYYANANSTRTSGVELDTRYKFKLGDYGTLKTELNWSHMFSYVLVEGGQPFQLVGTHGPSIIGGDTGNPQDRIQATFTWDKGAWDVATTFNWISSFDLTDPSAGVNDCIAGSEYSGVYPAGIPASESQYCKVASFLDTDVSVRYKFDKHWTVHGSITNLFNQAPPIDVQTYGAYPYAYNPSMHMAGAIGRMINVGANYTF
jgi:iron complex outermembrane receptor protein